jgi:diguanylate cyclase (GGDEF)-like protein/PAS domain S-box-containing protein
MTAPSPADPVLTVTDVLRTAAVHSVFQPIVDLDSRAVVAHEALARGPEGPLGSPVALFAAAREEGVLARLDEACRAAAFRGAVDLGLVAPLTVFVNVEPEVLDTAPLDDLLAIAQSAPGTLRVVLEITERALASRPAELLRTVERVRDLGWGVALDDVGADVASLAFMPLLRPDVVKLDLSLVQERPTPAVAEIMNAVNAYAEETGAVLLAEGIETEHHLTVARALGATLGQGWLFGRPVADPVPGPDRAALVLPVAPRSSHESFPSPFACLPATTVLRTSPKRLLVELSKQLEREAMRVGETCVVASTFQHAHHFTPSSAQRYRDLVERAAFVCALGEGLPSEPVPGLRGAALDPDDPVLGEWDLVVVGPHFSAALLARDLGDTGPDAERRFEYALTYRRDTVVRAAHALLARVAPREAAPGAADLPSPSTAAPAEDGAKAATGRPRGVARDALLELALGASTNGVSIADMTRPDHPLVYANAAFERLAGFPLEEVLGRNCRQMQGPDTDRAAVARIRAAIEAGEECRELILNYRGPERTPWWNEVHLSPVLDGSGRAVQYIGVQNDVTARVRAERALRHETDRARDYLTRIEELAWSDPLTGLMNRHRFEERVEEELWRTKAVGGALALLFLDLDGFKAVNDDLGHGAGDELLRVLAQRLRGTVRRSDLLARLGGDEFLVATTGLDPERARSSAEDIAAQLARAVAAPAEVRGRTVAVTTSIGISVFPEEASDVESLVHLADLRMYDRKHATR